MAFTGIKVWHGTWHGTIQWNEALHIKNAKLSHKATSSSRLSSPCSGKNCQLLMFIYIIRRHQMEKKFRVTGPLCGEFTGHLWIPSQRTVTRSFGVFLDLRLNKRLSKQSWGRWFKTPSCSLWRHCDVTYRVHWAIRQKQEPCSPLLQRGDNMSVSWLK